MTNLFRRSILLIIFEIVFQTFDFVGPVLLVPYQLLSISILFSLEAIQKCRGCQLCVLWENSSVASTPSRYS